MDRARGRLGPLTRDQELALEVLTRGIVNKILHTPMTTLKTAAAQPEVTTLVEVLRRLFNLGEDPRGGASGPKKD